MFAIIREQTRTNTLPSNVGHVKVHPLPRELRKGQLISKLKNTLQRPL